MRRDIRHKGEWNMKRYWGRLVLAPIAGALTVWGPVPLMAWRGALCFFMLTLAQLPLNGNSQWGRRWFWLSGVAGGLAAGWAVGMLPEIRFYYLPELAVIQMPFPVLAGCLVYGIGWNFCEFRLKKRWCVIAGVYLTACAAQVMRFSLTFGSGKLAGLLSCMILALPVTLLWLVLMAVGGVFAKQRAGEVAEEVR